MSAKHLLAPVILHYGHKCESPSELPVLHIKDPATFTLTDFIPSLENVPQKLYVIGSSKKKTQEVKAFFSENNKEVVEKNEADAVFYVGNGCCVSSLIENPEQNVWTLTSEGLEMHSSYQFISKRFHYISQVPDCQIFGIIISNLAVYNKIAAGLKGLLQKFNKIYYPIYLGKITPLKLGNFNEIDMFVMVSCSNTPLPDNKTLYKPVITPFELEVGLNGNWQGKYSTEFIGEVYDAERMREAGVADRFAQREFKGLEPENEGSMDVKEGYSGIAMEYKSEVNQ
jgi:diphthamide synthase subunit DPH2